MDESDFSTDHINCSNRKCIRIICIFFFFFLRTNVQHKKDCSHPGDADYDGQPECDSTSGGSPSKPRCWYGINCYRKNEEHKQKFHHSPPNSRTNYFLNFTITRLDLLL